MQNSSGKFGTVEIIEDHAIKTTKRFYKTSVEGAQQARDAFRHDRAQDMLHMHSFILPTKSVVIDPNSRDDSEYSSGLKITMPACVLNYKTETGIQEKTPHLDSLFEIYRIQLQTPEWIAYVAETILNLATALSYLHSNGLVHLDIKGNNVMVHTISPLEGTVDELFDKTKVYLADRGGANISWYIGSLERCTSTAPIMDDVSSSHLEESKIDGELSNNATFLRQQQIDIQRLGALAAYLLTGVQKIKKEKNAHALDERIYAKINPLLSSALDIIKALRKSGNEDLGVVLDNEDMPYTSMQDFIDTFSTALGNHFYVAKRADLPESVQDKLGTGGEGYVVCTHERFIRLMYVGRELTTEQQIQDMIRIAENPYQAGTLVLEPGNLSIQLPTQPLGTVQPIDLKLIEQIKAEQQGYIQRRDTEAMQIFEAAEQKIRAAEAERTTANVDHQKYSGLLELLK